MRREDEDDYVEFVTARLPRLHRQAYLLTGDRHRADDLVQQACVNLYVHWQQARAARNLNAYARATLLKVFLKERRRGWFTRVSLPGSLPDVPAPAPADLAEHDLLHRALQQVPPRQRAALVLRYLYDLPVEETAEALGCSPGTVKSQTARGLAALRRALSCAPAVSKERSDA